MAILATTVKASLRIRIGVVPAWFCCPGHGDLQLPQADDPGDDATASPAWSSSGPCSICISRNPVNRAGSRKSPRPVPQKRARLGKAGAVDRGQPVAASSGSLPDQTELPVSATEAVPLSSWKLTQDTGGPPPSRAARATSSPAMTPAPPSSQPPPPAACRNAEPTNSDRPSASPPPPEQVAHRVDLRAQPASAMRPASQSRAARSSSEKARRRTPLVAPSPPKRRSALKVFEKAVGVHGNGCHAAFISRQRAPSSPGRQSPGHGPILAHA